MAIRYKKIPGKIIASVALVILLGAGAAQLTVNEIADYEGYVPEAYKDPIGIWTKCFGSTLNVTPNAKYSFEHCVKSLNHEVELHAGPILKCVPELARQPDKVKAAMVSMAYNIGVGGFCSSSVARYANEGRWEAACKRIAQIYKTAGGKELPGLVKRRRAESRLCLEGVEGR